MHCEVSALENHLDYLDGLPALSNMLWTGESVRVCGYTLEHKKHRQLSIQEQRLVIIVDFEFSLELEQIEGCIKYPHFCVFHMFAYIES